MVIPPWTYREGRISWEFMGSGMSNGRMKRWTPSCSLFTNGPAPRAPRFSVGRKGRCLVRLSLSPGFSQIPIRSATWPNVTVGTVGTVGTVAWRGVVIPEIGCMTTSHFWDLVSCIAIPKKDWTVESHWKSGRWLFFSFFSYPDPEILGPSRCQHHADDAGRCQADFPIALHFCAKVRLKHP